MTERGGFVPATTEERLDRLESLDQIRQLSGRYAFAVDTKDLDALVNLFVPDVAVGRGRSGRAALRDWFEGVLSGFAASVHFVGTQFIDFVDPDHASGAVYCRDEMEGLDGTTWLTGMVLYHDTYRRLDGRWFFERRGFSRWYLVDPPAKPSRGAGIDENAHPRTARFPDDDPTWQEFWRSRPEAGGR